MSDINNFRETEKRIIRTPTAEVEIKENELNIQARGYMASASVEIYEPKEVYRPSDHRESLDGDSIKLDTFNPVFEISYRNFKNHNYLILKKQEEKAAKSFREEVEKHLENINKSIEWYNEDIAKDFFEKLLLLNVSAREITKQLGNACCTVLGDDVIKINKHRYYDTEQLIIDDKYNKIKYVVQLHPRLYKENAEFNIVANREGLKTELSGKMETLDRAEGTVSGWLEMTKSLWDGRQYVENKYFEINTEWNRKLGTVLIPLIAKECVAREMEHIERTLEQVYEHMKSVQNALKIKKKIEESRPGKEVRTLGI